MTAPKGSTKLLTGVKKVTHPPVNTAVNVNLKSPVSGKQRSDSRLEVLGWGCWIVGLNISLSVEIVMSLRIVGFTMGVSRERKTYFLN